MSTIKYLLDTNIVSELVRRPAGPVAQRIAEAGAQTVALSVVVTCELRFGAAKSGSRPLAERIEQLLTQVPSLPLEAPSPPNTPTSAHPWNAPARPSAPTTC